MEDYNAMEQRHKLELQQYQETAKAMLKAAKKSTKSQVEAQIIQMGFDIKAKHREEMDALEESLGGDVLDNLAAVSLAAPSTTPVASTNEKSEEEIAKAKKAKAKKKQDKKASKDREREEVKQQIHSQVGGQSQREAELQTLRSQLAKENFIIKDIPSDGNCLYRAIADQLFLTNHHSHEPTPDFKELRVLAANHIRKNAEEFAPFLGLMPQEPDFDTYCNKVASDTLAEWGGQLEIRALSECLQREIHIYSAAAPLLKMGDSSSLPPLRLAFHRHYYALGEHYNSISRAETCCS